MLTARDSELKSGCRPAHDPRVIRRLGVLLKSLSDIVGVWLFSKIALRYDGCLIVFTYRITGSYKKRGDKSQDIHSEYPLVYENMMDVWLNDA